MYKQRWYFAGLYLRDIVTVWLYEHLEKHDQCLKIKPWTDVKQVKTSCSIMVLLQQEQPVSHCVF